MTIAALKKYKVVVAASTDTDPPSNPIWTMDDWIGVSPPYVNINELPTPYDYACVGDGVADDTINFQKWLDAIAGRAGFGAPGTFAVSSSVSIWSDTTIYGAGKGSFVLAKRDGFPSSQQLLLNKNLIFSPNVPVDKNIAIYGTCFQGLTADVTATDMIGFAGITGLTLRDCLGAHHRYTILALSNCTNGVIDACEFTDWGKSGSSDYGGACLWIGAADSDVRVTNCFFHQGLWGAIFTNATGCTIANNRIFFVNEYGIGGTPSNCSITGNTISSIVRQRILAYGIVVGGNDITVAGNVIQNCEADCVHFTDVTHGNISGNTLTAPGQDQAYFTNGACIGVDCFASAPYGILVNNNMCSDGTGKAAAGICLTTAGPEFVASQFVNNNLAPGNQWRVSSIIVGAGVSGSYSPTSDFMARGNLGSANEDASLVNFLLPAGLIAGATKRIGGVGFKPRSIDFQCCLSAPGTAYISIGQAMWLTGWDATTNAVTTARANFVSNAISSATDGTNAESQSSVGMSCINIHNGLGVVIARAALSAVDDDGFTLTIVDATTTDPIAVNAICHP